MADDLASIEHDARAQIAAAGDLPALDAVRVAFLGKQGSVSAMLKTLGKMSPEERQEKGPAIQQLRAAVSDAIVFASVS